MPCLAARPLLRQKRDGVELHAAAGQLIPGNCAVQLQGLCTVQRMGDKEILLLPEWESRLVSLLMYPPQAQTKAPAYF